MRLLRTAHAWAGAVLCILLAVLALSGTLLVLKADYLRLTFPEARQPLDLSPQRLGATISVIETQLAGEGISYVSVADQNASLHKVVFKDGGGAYVSQDGAVVDRWTKNGRVEEWLFDLHHYLLAGNTGKLIAGVAAVAAVLLIISGLVIVWPALRVFAWRGWPQSGKRQHLLANHRDLGVIFAAPLLVLTVTGASLVFSEQARALMAFLPTDNGQFVAVGEAQDGDVNWPRVFEVAKTQFPDAVPRIVSWPRADRKSASLRVRREAEWHQNGRTYLYFNPATDALVGAQDALKLDTRERVFNTFYPLHSAGVGGRLYDLVSFASGLVLAALGCIGCWTFLTKKRRRKAVPQHAL